MQQLAKMFLASGLTFNFAAGLLAPIYAIFVQQIGGNILEASGAYAIFTIVLGSLILLVGRLEDKIRNKALMVAAGQAVVVAATFGYLLIQTPLHLFIVQALLGVGLAVATPAWDAIYSKGLDRGRESTIWSFWEGGVNIVIGISAIAGGLIASFFGFRALFIAMFFIQVFALIIATAAARRG